MAWVSRTAAAAAALALVATAGLAEIPYPYERGEQSDPYDQSSIQSDPHWMLDTRTGCWAYDSNANGNDSISWSGECPFGRADGRGTLTFYDHGRVFEQLSGVFDAGVLEDGHVSITWSDGSHYDGEEKDGQFNGRGVLVNADGTRYDGLWRNDKFVEAEPPRDQFANAPQASEQARHEDGAQQQNEPAAQNADNPPPGANVVYTNVPQPSPYHDAAKLALNAPAAPAAHAQPPAAQNQPHAQTPAAPAPQPTTIAVSPAKWAFLVGKHPKLVAADGARLSLTIGKSGVLAYQLVQPDGAVTKRSLAFVSDKLGALSDEKGDVAATFQVKDKSLAINYADGRSETYVAGKQGLTLIAQAPGAAKSETYWYPAGHRFSRAERKRALKDYAARLVAARVALQRAQAAATAAPVVAQQQTPPAPPAIRSAIEPMAKPDSIAIAAREAREARAAAAREAREAAARAAQEEAAREAAAKEAQARAAHEAALREARAAAKREAREAAARAAQEAAAREAQARAAREAAAKEAHEAALREAREAAAKQAHEAALREAREAQAKEAREEAQREAAERQAREAAQREAQAAREAQAKETAAREAAAREAAAREAQAREAAAKEAAAKEAAAKEAAAHVAQNIAPSATVHPPAQAATRVAALPQTTSPAARVLSTIAPAAHAGPPPAPVVAHASPQTPSTASSTHAATPAQATPAVAHVTTPPPASPAVAHVAAPPVPTPAVAHVVLPVQPAPTAPAPANTRVAALPPPAHTLLPHTLTPPGSPPPAPPRRSASDCLSVVSNGTHWGFRNNCVADVQFAYCVMNGTDRLTACGDSAVPGSVAGHGFTSLVADLSMKEPHAARSFRWVGCVGGAGEVVPRLDSADPPMGRCLHTGDLPPGPERADATKKVAR